VTTSSSELAERPAISAWARWELASLQAPAPRAGSEEADAQQLAAVQAAAQAAGHAAGYAAGLHAAEQERARLTTLLATFESAACDHEQRLVDEVLDLALVLARQLVGEALSVRREFIVPIVSAALKQLPQSTQRIEIALNPADLELVQRLVSDSGFATRSRFVADASIAPGGCLVETEQSEIDVTVPSRWRRLLASLGRSDDWLEPV
jgi:flagellar assembly protein FliH